MAFNYSPNIVTSGLTLYLDVANNKSYFSGSTAWNDLSGNRNNGTLFNSPTYDSANLGSIVFDGIDDYMTTTLTTNYLNNSTQSIWYKWNGNNQFVTLLYLGNAGSNGFGLLLHDGTGGAIGNRIGVLYGGITFNALSTSVELTSNSWNHLVLTRNTTTTTLYNNGQFFDSTTNSPNTTTSYNFNYGSSTSWGAGGNVSNISFYNRALTATEVLQNYNALKGRFGL